MIPAGYMAKLIVPKPDWLKSNVVKQIYSVSGCISENFTDFMNYWKHNKYYFYDSPDKIKQLSTEHDIDISKCEFLYYELFEKEFSESQNSWKTIEPDDEVEPDVKPPVLKNIIGYDIVNYSCSTNPECSIASCNNLAEEMPVNEYCLFSTFDDAKVTVERVSTFRCEPGPFRILSVCKI
jgi:hypothetical protein